MKNTKRKRNEAATPGQVTRPATPGRYIYIKPNGKIAFETDMLELMRAARVGAEFMQDRETGRMYDVLPSGPISHRLRIHSGK